MFFTFPEDARWNADRQAVENFFPALTRKRLKRGVFRSIADPQAAMNRYLKAHNDDPKPFVWTKSVDPIIVELNRLPMPSF
jgi:hypothetical protein